MGRITCYIKWRTPNGIVTIHQRLQIIGLIFNIDAIVDAIVDAVVDAISMDYYHFEWLIN